MATTQSPPKQRPYAGLFRRMGRSKKELTILAEAETERRWAGLAEWLRAAHSLLDEKTSGLTDPSAQVRAIE